MTVVNKNAKAYDSGDVAIIVDAMPFSGVKEISYSTKQEHQLNYALGSDPHSWSKGKTEHAGSVTIYMEDLHAMMKIRGANILKWEPVTINVTFVNEVNDIINDTVYAKFQSMGREVTGEMGLATQFELFVLGIDYDNF